MGSDFLVESERALTTVRNTTATRTHTSQDGSPPSRPRPLEAPSGPSLRSVGMPPD